MLSLVSALAMQMKSEVFGVVSRALPAMSDTVANIASLGAQQTRMTTFAAALEHATLKGTVNATIAGRVVPATSVSRGSLAIPVSSNVLADGALRATTTVCAPMDDSELVFVHASHRRRSASGMVTAATCAVRTIMVTPAPIHVPLVGHPTFSATAAVPASMAPATATKDSV